MNRVIAFVLSLYSVAACSGEFIVGDYHVPSDTGIVDLETSGTTTGPNDIGTIEPIDAAPTHVFAAPHAIRPEAPASGALSMRAIDWDRDGDNDLFISTNEGQIHYIQQGNADWQPPVPVYSGGVPLRSPLGRVDLSLVDVDGWPELWFAGAGSQMLRLRAVDPTSGVDFSEPVALTLTLPEGCQGRVSLGDWDADGQLDLLAGGQELGVWLLAGHSDDSDPLTFAPAQSLGELELGAGARPRAQHLDGDLQPELIVIDDSGFTRIGRRRRDSGGQTLPLTWDRLPSLQGPDGLPLNLSQRHGVDAGVELAELNGDGVLDLGVTGSDGQIMVYPGRAYAELLTQVAASLAVHADDLPRALASDLKLRAALAGDLVALRTAVDLGLVSRAFVETIDAELSAIVTTYPQYFRRRAYDTSTEAYLPRLVAQLWITLLEARPTDSKAREDLADRLGFESGHRALLVDHGLLYIDNQQASAEQLAAVHRVMSVIPADLRDLNVLLAPAGLGLSDGMPNLSARGVVDVFASDIHRTENLFPEDIEPRESGLYVGALAHQVNHFTLDRVGRRQRAQLYRRKFDRLAELAPVDFVFHHPKTRGVDWSQTQARFVAHGHWDQGLETWDEALDRYFNAGPGQALAWWVPGGDAKLVLTRPDELFATLAGQYFADSRHLLRLCLERFDRGYALNLELFLDFVDYYSGGNQTSFFFAAEPVLHLERESVTLARDAGGWLVQLDLPGTAEYDPSSFRFERDATGRLIGWREQSR